MDDSSCAVGCEGLYADIDFVKSTSREHSNDSLATLIKEYEKYKRSQIDSFEIVHTDRTYGDQFQIVRRPYQPLQIVQLYFDTATYDNIIRDVSVTLADQLGAIGGTMGLFAGFSFLSALEIIYYVVKYLISLVNRKINV